MGMSHFVYPPIGWYMEVYISRGRFIDNLKHDWLMMMSFLVDGANVGYCLVMVKPSVRVLLSLE